MSAASRVCYRLLPYLKQSRGSLKVPPQWRPLSRGEGGRLRHLCTGSAVFQSSENESGKKATTPTTTTSKPTFASLFRNSPLVQLGPPEGKVVVGTVVDVVGDDLYIDFGFKFTAVCRRPKVNAGNYVQGSTVKVRINDLELSDRFLGSTQDMTLLEADVTLLGLVSSPVPASSSSSSPKSASEAS
ncbi:PREDICTED: 28S ribosomal protein S28, mitochondrial-like [Rhagoletis zephyria]|uniref:28S ribosomal protein S28, mitochondrial-like n=1 Tax=Rhagoletis zephyria TaxID=28612 RepID=UPI0008119E90|nr:PREDICTED: 28S ribosomal protein S28, mitochondrial-like [Rhagoletis zephyria]